MTPTNPKRPLANERSRALVSALALFALAFLSLPAHAQEQINPRTGQLVLTVTDLTLQAGPITLELQRTLETRPNHQGLLGNSWTSNWESRVSSTPSAVVIEGTPYAIAFARESGKQEYRSVFGEQVIVQGDGRLRTTTSGTTGPRAES